MNSDEKEAARLIGDKGNLAMREKIAPALERAKRSNGEGISLYVNCCNLDEQAILRLVNAVEKSTCLYRIDCKWNPGNNDGTEKAMKRAIIATKSPIKEWNGNKLSADIVKAWREREVNPPVRETNPPVREANPPGEETNPPGEEANPRGEEANLSVEEEELRSPTRTRVLTAAELASAQRESQFIISQIANKEGELNAGLEKLAREEALKTVLQTQGRGLQQQMRGLQEQMRGLREQMRGLKQQTQQVERKIGASRSGNNQLRAQVDALKQRLASRQAGSNQMQELEDRVQQLTLSASPTGTTIAPPPQAHQVSAIICPRCNRVEVNAVFLCGHRVCKPCGDHLLATRERCPQCDAPIAGMIPFA